MTHFQDYEIKEATTAFKHQYRFSIHMGYHLEQLQDTSCAVDRNLSTKLGA